MPDNQDILNILIKLGKNPNQTQRRLSKELKLSLGKISYCLDELKKKGLIKIENFKNNPSKINYIYLLTPAGIEHKLKLTVSFMKKKLEEYDNLKKELEIEKKKLNDLGCCKN